MFAAMRRLHPRGAASKGICVDAEGAMLGPDCVLVGKTPRGFCGIERAAASAIQKCVLGDAGDPDWLFRQCQYIADALNAGEPALAQIYGLRIPVGDLDDRQLRRIARVGLTKAGFNPDEPRIPKGDHGGGEWTNGGGDSAQTDPGGPSRPREYQIASLDVPPLDDAGGPPVEFRIVSPDTDTASQEAAPESGSVGEATVGVSPTRGTDAESTLGEQQAASHHSPGNSGGAADYHVDAINPDYTFENLLFFFAGGTARKLMRALIKDGFKRGVDEDTHHIVPREAKRVDPARKILERFGIDLDDFANGIFLPEARHDRLHGNRYYDAINRELAAATTKSEAEQILRSIAQRLEEGIFP